MNDELMDILHDLLEQARHGEIDRIAYVVLSEDGGADYGYSPLDAEGGG